MPTVITDAQAKKNIASNLRRLLDERQLSQNKLAEATGEARMTICRIANGKHVPGVALLARIAEALEVSVDFLLTGKDRKSRRSA